MNKNINPEGSPKGNRERAPKNAPPMGREDTDNTAESENAGQESNGLREMLVDEMADVFNAEKQLTKALPKMAKAAQCEDLREALESHLEETEQQITRMEEAFELLGEKVKSKKCKAMEGLLVEGSELMEEHEGKPTMDAALVAAGQKVEHYEIASYGTLCAWAKKLGEDEVASLLHESLEEEKAADEKLTELAEATENAEAEEAD